MAGVNATKKQTIKKIVNYLVYLLVVSVLLQIDITTKMFMSGQELIKITDWFELRLALNPGSAFSLPIPIVVTRLLGIILAIILVLVPILTKEKLSKLKQFCLAVITAGVLGNTIDRIVHGVVIDFISFSFWPNFNVADIYLTCGVIALILLELLTNNPDQKTNQSNS